MTGFEHVNHVALENPFVPFTVAKLPAAYTHALRKTYDASKMFWVSNQIMAVTQGFYSVFSPTVAESVRQAEENSLRLVESSRTLPKNKFAAALNDNAVKIFNDRQKFYERLIMQYNGGAGIDYKYPPVPDAPKNY